MPTLVVFVALTPAMFIVGDVYHYYFNPFVIIGAAIMLFGAAMEFFADIQMHKFRKNNADKDKVCDVGLWKYSRHPNYLGEILVWLGVYVFMAIMVLPNLWGLEIAFLLPFAVGAIAMFCLFWFISIPLMEKRQMERRAGYAEYKKRTSKLFLLPPKSGKK